MFPLDKIVLLLLVTNCFCFYLPGLAPVNYCEEGKETDRCRSSIPVFVNRLTSFGSAVPFDYNYFDFCKPRPGAAVPPVENLGQIVFGERIQSSPYHFLFDPLNKTSQNCQFLCEKNYKKNNYSHTQETLKLRKAIRLDYQHHFIVDNMPVTFCYKIKSDQTFCSNGFPVGCFVGKNGLQKTSCLSPGRAGYKPGSFYIYNHLDFQVTYHSGKNEKWGYKLGDSGGRIIRVDVVPRSIQHPADALDCSADQPMVQLPSEASRFARAQVRYSYSVTFRENNSIKWSSRWDYLLNSFPGAHIQWFMIITSLAIVALLSGMVALILMRTVWRDISRYNRLDTDVDVSHEEFGWKLVHGDVFRPPTRRLLLASLLGSGVQLLAMLAVTLVFACLGFLSPANRGSLMTCGLLVFACLGVPAGYVSARLYKSFRGERRAAHVLLTALLCPGLVLGVTLPINVVMWYEQSSAAMPFLTILALFAIWIFGSLPLIFVGAYFGYRRRAIEHPVRTNQIPRQIPPQTLSTGRLFNVLIGGILPFSCVFIQLYFILNSIWADQIFYMFGVLFVVVNILALMCAQVTVLLCYFHLCAEDYRWWWRSFFTAGSTALYVFAYCCFYYGSNLSVDEPVSLFLYFGYTVIIVFLVFLATGTIGFFATFWFVRKIYSAVKVD